MFSLNAICKATGKQWRFGAKAKSAVAPFFEALLLRFNNTAAPPGHVQTLTTDHGEEVLSNQFKAWLRSQGIFHLTAPRREPNYNAIIEQKHMAFTMLSHSKKPKGWWDYAFDWAVFVLDRCPRRSNQHSVTPFETFFGGNQI